MKHSLPQATLTALLLCTASAAVAQDKPTEPTPANQGAASAQQPAGTGTPPTNAPSSSVQPQATPSTGTPAAKPQFVFAMHGFLGGSVYWQNALTGASAGAQALYAGGSLKTDSSMFSGDIRQNRMNFSVAGPSVLGATPKGVAELDLFGGNSTGGYGDVSLLPRIRVAYAELAWGNTVIQVGQQYSLVLGISPLGMGAPLNLPTSVGHIAFPLTYAAGTIGWRHPGIFAYHRIDMGDNKLELALEVARSAWVNPANPGSATVSGTTAAVPFGTISTDLGSASGLPQVQGRITYAAGKMLTVMIAGHYMQIDPSGWGADAATTGTCGVAAATACDNKSSYSGVAAARIAAGALTLQGGGYIGQNTAPLLGNVLQFNNLGVDVADEGAWGQLGFNLSPELSAWALYGLSRTNPDDAHTSGQAIAANNVGSAMLRYMVGGYAFSLEYAHWHTNYNKPPTAANANGDGKADADQLMFSSFFFF